MLLIVAVFYDEIKIYIVCVKMNACLYVEILLASTYSMLRKVEQARPVTEQYKMIKIILHHAGLNYRRRFRLLAPLL